VAEKNIEVSPEQGEAFFSFIHYKIINKKELFEQID